jgi:hypothetical protein
VDCDCKFCMEYYESECDVELGLLTSCLESKWFRLVSCPEVGRACVFALARAALVGLTVNCVQTIMTFTKSYPCIPIQTSLRIWFLFLFSRASEIQCSSCSLFNEAVSSSGYIASNGCLGKNMEVSKKELIKEKNQAFCWENRGKPQKFSVRIVGVLAEIWSSTSRKQVTSDTAGCPGLNLCSEIKYSVVFLCHSIRYCDSTLNSPL